MYEYPMMNNFSAYGWAWGLGMMAFWGALFIFGVYVVIRLLREHDSSRNDGATPLDIAKQRYAKGDITKAQFEELKKDLK